MFANIKWNFKGLHYYTLEEILPDKLNCHTKSSLKGIFFMSVKMMDGVSIDLSKEKDL